MFQGRVWSGVRKKSHGKDVRHSEEGRVNKEKNEAWFIRRCSFSPEMFGEGFSALVPLKSIVKSQSRFMLSDGTHLPSPPG